MRVLANLALAVLVIAGWTMALSLLAASVAQIAVERVVSPSLCVSAAPGEIACRR